MLPCDSLGGNQSVSEMQRTALIRAIGHELSGKSRHIRRQGFDPQLGEQARAGAVQDRRAPTGSSKTQFCHRNRTDDDGRGWSGTQPIDDGRDAAQGGAEDIGVEQPGHAKGSRGASRGGSSSGSAHAPSEARKSSDQASMGSMMMAITVFAHPRAARQFAVRQQTHGDAIAGGKSDGVTGHGCCISVRIYMSSGRAHEHICVYRPKRSYVSSDN